MTDEPLGILLCGSFANVEMLPIEATVVQLAPDADVRRAASPADLPATWSNGTGRDDSFSPDLIVVAQSRPEEFRTSDVRRLQARFPLVRCVCCYGAWCESDGRNSTLWPDAVRVSARTAVPRLRREFAVLRGQHDPLPLTASRDEMFEYDFTGDWSQTSRGAKVGVKSLDRRFREMLVDLLTAADHTVNDDADLTRTELILWDVDPWLNSVASELRDACADCLHPPVVALMNFSHPSAAAKVFACGAHAVVPKLAPAEVLLAAIVQCQRTASRSL